MTMKQLVFLLGALCAPFSFAQTVIQGPSVIQGGPAVTNSPAGTANQVQINNGSGAFGAVPVTFDASGNAIFGANGAGNVTATNGSFLGAVTGQKIGAGSCPAGAPTGSVCSGGKVLPTMGSATGYQGFGDSKQCNTGSSAANGLSSYENDQFFGMRPILGGDFETACVPGDTLVDTNYYVFIHTYNNGPGGPNFEVETGTNDANLANGGTTGYEQSAQQIMAANILFPALPRGNQIFAQDSAVTTSGTWTPDFLYVYKFGQSSTTNGSVINIPVTVTSNGLWGFFSRIIDSNGGTYTVQLDSGALLADPVTSSTTWSSTGYGGVAIASSHNHPYGWAAYWFTGATAGVHTIKITVTSTTSASNIVDVGGGFAVPATNTANPFVLVESPEHQNGSGDTLSGTYATMESGLVTTLSGSPWNLNVLYADTRNALLTDPTCGNGVLSAMYTNCYFDTLHLNNKGQAVQIKTKLAVIAAFNPALTLGSIATPIKGPSDIYNYSGGITQDPARWFFPGKFSPGTSGYGAGVRFNQAGGGLNVSGIGNLGPLGNGLLLGGGDFVVLQCEAGNTFACPNPTASAFAEVWRFKSNLSIIGFRTPAAPLGSIYIAGTWVTMNAGIAGTASGNPSGTVGGYAPYYLVSPTAATATTGSASPSVVFRSGCGNGTVGTVDDLSLSNTPTATNIASPVQYLKLAHANGCAATFGVDFSAATAPNNLGNVTTGPASNLQAASLESSLVSLGSLQNYIQNSLTMTGSGWSANNGTATAGQADYEGGTNAVSFQSASSSGSYQNIPTSQDLVGGTTYTLCGWIKGAAGNEGLQVFAGAQGTGAIGGITTSWTLRSFQITPTTSLTRTIGFFATTSANQTVYLYKWRVAPGTSCPAYLGTTTPVTVPSPQIVSPALALTSLQTTVSCSTSGSATFAEPLIGPADKKVVIHLAACNGTASYTFPVAFANTPSVYGSNNVAASVATSLSTTAVTITGATSTGSIVLEDF